MKKSLHSLENRQYLLAKVLVFVLQLTDVGVLFVHELGQVVGSIIVGVVSPLCDRLTSAGSVGAVRPKKPVIFQLHQVVPRVVPVAVPQTPAATCCEKYLYMKSFLHK